MSDELTLMKKKWTQEQIIGLLREAESGQTSITELCRLRGISQNSFYTWRNQYGGMNVDEAKKLKALEAENAKLKKLVADLSLDKLALEEVLSKKW
jgi:putative transposase